MRSVRFAVLLSLAIAFCLSIPAVRADPVLPIAHWSGNVDGRDETGNGNDATLQGGATAGVPGIVGGAFQFDGINDIANTSFILPSIGTIDLWVNPGSLSIGHVLVGTFGLDNGSDRLWIGMSGPDGTVGGITNSLLFNVGDRFADDELSIPNPAAQGEWSHIAVTFDYVSDAYFLYVNGAFAAAAPSGDRYAPSQPLSIGGALSDWGHDRYFPGLLDEIRVYDRVLTESEVRGLYTATVPEPGTILLLSGGLLALAAVRRRMI